MKGLVLHADIDAFFASVEERDNPELKGKPFIVWNPYRRTPVMAASYKAKELGIDSGMPIEEADQRYHDLIKVIERPDVYREISLAFFEILIGFNREMEPYGNDEAWLNYTGNTFENVYNEGVKIKEMMSKELGVPVSIGISYWRIPAKQATNYGKPDGLFVIRNEEEFKRTQHPLPVRELHGIGPKTEKILNEKYGVYTIGGIGNAPLYTFMPYLGRWWDIYFHLLANGIDYSPFTPWYKPIEIRSIGNTLRCDSPNPNYLRRRLKMLSSIIADRMKSADYHSRTVTLTVQYNYKTSSRSRTRKRLFNDEETIYSMVEELFSGLSTRRRIVRIGVKVSNLDKGRHQLEFDF